MIWKTKERIEGDTKIKKHFCIFPRSDYNANTGVTTWYWLETVYILYIWHTPCYTDDTAYWHKIGIATSYENAANKIWE